MSKTVVKPQRLSIASNCLFSSLALVRLTWRSPGVKIWTWLFQKPATTNFPEQSIFWKSLRMLVEARVPTLTMRLS